MQNGNPIVATGIRIKVSLGGLDGGLALDEIEVNSPPINIVSQPQSQTIAVSGNATFCVTASGAGTLGYQWRFNGDNISAATGNCYTSTGAQCGDAGSYDVVVTSSSGSVTSSVATLTVVSPPSINDQPENQTANAGQSVNFTVVATTACGDIAYQWRRNEVSILGATASTYQIAAAQCMDAGNYDVVVTNIAGSVTSSVATLTVTALPVINNPPANQVVTIGQSATFSVTASVGCGSMAFQWQFNGTDISGATSSSYTRINSQPADAGNYAVVLTNSAGSVTSTVATLTVNQPEIAVEQPSGNDLVDGVSSVDFGSGLLAMSHPRTFTIRNTGVGDLTGLGISIDGPNAAEFTVAANPVAPVSQGGSTTFTVTFTPQADGVRTAALHLTSNDTNESPFDLTLIGNGVGFGLFSVEGGGGSALGGCAVFGGHGVTTNNPPAMSGQSWNFPGFGGNYGGSYKGVSAPGLLYNKVDAYDDRDRFSTYCTVNEGRSRFVLTNVVFSGPVGATMVTDVTYSLEVAAETVSQANYGIGGTLLPGTTINLGTSGNFTLYRITSSPGTFPLNTPQVLELFVDTSCVAHSVDANPHYGRADVRVHFSPGPVFTLPLGYDANGSGIVNNSLAVPLVTGFNPAQGLAGTEVTITGLNLGDATSVAFNDVPASFTINPGNQIVATVPPWATTGAITVHTPNGRTASAGDFVVAPPSETVSYGDFSNVSGLQLNGHAAAATTSDGAVLQLTPAVTNRAGSAFLATPISIAYDASFSTFFSFRLSQGGPGNDVDGVPGADGIAFVVSTNPNSLIPGGGGIGYQGIPNSVAVEFDTYYNFGGNDHGDADGNHVAIHVNGGPVTVGYAPVTPALNNGGIWYAWIDYNGPSRTLEVRLSQTNVRPASPTITGSVNLWTTLGTANAHFGFTGATGALYNQQDVLTWQLAVIRPIATWTGASGTDLLWATPGNWSSLIVPGPNSVALFMNTGATNNPASVNNTVAADHTIKWLNYSQTNGSHHTLISPGATLTVLSNLLVGTETFTNIVVTNRISGPGASLVVGNGSANSTIIVRQAGAAGAAHRATLDLSGLDHFTANVGRVLVGVGTGGPNRATGRLILARTNLITASSVTSPAFDIGDSSVNGGTATTLVLGETNAIFANTITIGRGKEGGVNMFFNSAGSAGYFRSANGVGRVTTFAIADGGNVTATVAALATANFGGGTVDALIDTLAVGRGSTALNTIPFSSTTGTLTFDQGIIDANTVLVGANVVNSTNSGRGTINVNGAGLLVANAVVELGRTVNPVAGGNTVGTLNINGGTVRANSVTNAGTGTAIVTLNNGTLVLSNRLGSAALPVTSLSLTNATLHLWPAVASPVAIVSDLLTDGAANTINIEALPGDGQFQLIKYVGTFGGAGFNFVLGTLPPFFSGYLSNNIGESSIDLVVATISPPTITVQPQTQSVIVGDDATFTVTAEGTVPLSYQWRINGVDISGATDASYTIPSAQCANASSYDVVVTNIAGSATSSVAVLTVVAPPVILTQPASQTTNVGQSVVFSVSATNDCGDGLTYQWRKGASNLSDGGNISGVTSPTLTLANVQLADAGDYSVVVTNASGSVTSAMATLSLGNVYSIALAPVGDTSLFAKSPNNNFGGGTTFAAGDTADDTVVRGLMLFDIAGSIPAGATINLVSLQLTVTSIPPGGSSSFFDLNRVLASWGEGTGNDQLGSPAQPGDATWNTRHSPGTMWTTPGGDFSMIASASTLIADLGDYMFGSTPGLVADVQTWLDNPANNFGWLLRSQSELTPRTARRFASREGNPGDRPALVIQFSVPGPPGILAQPESRTNIIDTTATFSVTATGNTPLSYQWRINGADISGATDASYTIPSAQCADAGDYDVVVTNIAGSATSSVAALTVVAPPVILTQPANRTNNSGEIATFTVTATNDCGGGLTYQWRFNGTDIPGATSATLILPIVQLEDAGSYDVVITNIAGSVTSAVATLIVSSTCIIPPPGNMPPACAYINFGDVLRIIDGLAAGATIEIDAEHRDFINITRAPGGSLAGEVQSFSSTLQFRMRGTGNSTGYDRVLTLSNVQVQTHIGPRNPTDPFQSFPIDLFSLQGQILGDPDFNLLRITAGTGFGMPSPGQTMLTQLGGGNFNVDSFFDITYRMDFVGAPGGPFAGRSGSTIGTVRLQAGPSLLAPAIVIQPQSRTNVVGTTAAFSVAGIGPEPLSYQWRKDGANLSNSGGILGATSPLLTLENVQPTNGGNYTVVVTNDFGSVTSAAATLTIVVPLLTEPTFVSGDEFTFKIGGEAGTLYVIQVSSSLTEPNWISISTNVAGSTFTDSNTGNNVQGYYRVVPLP